MAEPNVDVTDAEPRESTSTEDPVERAQGRRKLSTPSPVIIIIGEGAHIHRYSVHEFCLSTSDFLLECIKNERWSDSTTREITVGNVSSHYFEIYLYWLLSRELDMKAVKWCVENLALPGGPVIQLALVGKKFCDNKFSNAIMKSVNSALSGGDTPSLSRYVWGGDHVTEAYDLLGRESMVYKWHVENAMHFWTLQDLQLADEEQTLPREFLKDLCGVMLSEIRMLKGIE